LTFPYRSDTPHQIDTVYPLESSRMKLWPTDLQGFQPAEVATLTGVPPEKQRLWMSRHGFDWRDYIEPEGRSPQWRWSGVLRLAALSEIVGDLSMEAALALVTCAGTGRDQDHAMDEAFGFDWRNDSRGDWLLVKQLGTLGDGQTVPALGPFLPVGGIATAFGKAPFSRPPRFYAFNLSDLQRRMCEKIGLGD
jgi:hypothetical protein